MPSSLLAIDGGTPVRINTLQYGRQTIDADDEEAVLGALRSDYLTTGPMVERFEQAFADKVGAEHCVAVSSGTAALHAAMHAISIGPGDEVIVPTMTFVATANAVVYMGAAPVFAESDPETLLLDPDDVERKITDRTRAVVGVDYMGQPCNYDRLSDICRAHGLALIADAAHSLGAGLALADLTTYSLHPVKPITTGEGGMVATDDDNHARQMRSFRNHGIVGCDQPRTRPRFYARMMVELGHNYRLSDMACALGLSQLNKLGSFIARRQSIARRYDAAFSDLDSVNPVKVVRECGYHLYVIQLGLDRLTVARDRVFLSLQAEGIGVNVHYSPVHYQPFYRKHFGTWPGMVPITTSSFYRLITLPLFPAMTDGDIADVVAAVRKVVGYYAR